MNLNFRKAQFVNMKTRSSKKVLKPSKKKSPPREISDASIEECLSKLNSDYGNVPLPGREKEIEKISSFIEEALTKNQFKILYISGSPGTGKTASVKHCINQASHPYEINFINCKTEKPKLIAPEDNPPKLLVLDEVESLSNYQDIITNCSRYKCSILCISNAHDKTIAISKAHLSNQESLIFDPYSVEQLKTILIERMGGLSENIKDSAIKYIANKVGQAHGDARTIISTMNYILTQSINEGLKEITDQTAVRFTNAQKESDPSQEIISQLPIYEQIALVAIFKAGKDWIKEYSNLLAQKNLRGLPPNISEFFDRLTSYGFVSGSVKAPKCRLSKEQLKNGLDKEISVYL